MSDESRLIRTRSAYLRSAAHQPVDWYAWSDEAFDRARKENKPILLDIGAAWCHWCHVIDRESYENAETGRLINELFVPIKVDRDERPDVDARYQQAVMALTGQGGWPLTGFLTPDGDLFWGGTYFPPEDRYGRPGFPRVLREVARFFRTNADDARKQGEQIREMLARTSSTAPDGTALDAGLVDAAVEKIRRAFDPTNGGFGSQPKFPHPGGIDLLLRRYAEGGDGNELAIATATLRGMGRGGVYDQLGGGFHRYSVDARWIVPHFEKMLYDNSALLRNYAWGYALSGDEFLGEIARGIVAFVDTVGSDRAIGGFYASQDADMTLEDDGDYWTWTVDEARAALSEDEFAVAQRHWDIDVQGEMHDDPRRNVLFVAQDVPDVAKVLGMDERDAARLLDRARSRLLAARGERKTPFVDRTIYLNWNGMMIVAYLDAARLLDLPACREFALTTLERLLAEGSLPDGGVVHRLDDRDVPATADDQVQMGLACLSAFQTTGDAAYLARARRLADVLLDRFADAEAGGFFDIPPQTDGIPILRAPVKPIQDSPTGSTNGVAVQFFELLGRIAEEERYRAAAETTLRAFATIASQLGGLYGGAYFVGLDAFLAPPPVAVVVGPMTDAKTRALRDALLAVPRWGAAIVTHDPGADEKSPLPAAVASMFEAYDPARGPLAYVCAGASCAMPTGDPKEAAETLRTMGKHHVESAGDQ